MTTIDETASRSPPRTANRPSQSATPGVLAISSAMLANANKASGKKSKTTTERRSQNGSSASLFDPSALADPSTPGSSVHARPEPTSALTAMMTGQSTSGEVPSPANSPSKRTRSRRRAKPGPTASDGDDTAGYSEDPAAAVQTPASASKASRPQQSRGLSAKNLALTSASQEHSAAMTGQSDPTSLSKSAPASSFLESMQQTRSRRGKQNPPTNSSKDAIASSKAPIRGSNSADEWEMPSSHLITGADALTWQQQAALTRKPSQQGKKNAKSTEVTAFKKQQTQATSHAGTPTSATAPSGLSNAMAAGAAKTQSSAQASPALTWQQALLQRSTPATPSSDIFEALEEGHSGARPASDHHRTRSSPVKTSRPLTRSQQPVATSKSSLADGQVADLDKQLNDLVLSSVKPSTAAQPKSAKKAKPMAMKSDTHGEKAQSSDREAAQQPLGTSPSVAKPIPLASSSTSPNKAALYAGPKFHNSPHAAQLPTPRLAAFLNRNRESSPVSQSPSTTEPIFA